MATTSAGCGKSGASSSGSGGGCISAGGGGGGAEAEGTQGSGVCGECVAAMVLELGSKNDSIACRSRGTPIESHRQADVDGSHACKQHDGDPPVNPPTHTHTHTK